MLAKLTVPLAAAIVLLAGCTNTQTALQTAGVSESMEGAARSCTVTPTELPKGTAASVKMQVGNDGGWCAVRMTDKDGTAYLYPKLTQRPAHGRILVHTVSGRSRVEYIPATGYAGNDAFTVALTPKDKSADVALTVAVTVTK